jgi:hypothetical protein
MAKTASVSRSWRRAANLSATSYMRNRWLLMNAWRPSRNNHFTGMRACSDPLHVLVVRVPVPLSAELPMKSSTLAVTLVALIGAFAALDLSGAHQLPAVEHAAPQMRTVSDEATEDDEVEGRIVQTFLRTEVDGATHGRAVHRCVSESATDTRGPLQYCFGAPAPTLVYD